jgi:hypothetical protein
MEQVGTEIDIEIPPRPPWWRALVPLWFRGLLWVDEMRSFDAFLSYRQAVDAKVAPLIQSVLQDFLRPWYKTRARDIFRDLSCLPAGTDLLKELAGRLDVSTHLIVLAGPEAKKSPGMEFEARHWFSRQRKGKILIIVTHGDFKSWDDHQDDPAGPVEIGIRNGALPPSLQEKLQAQPLYIDLRKRRENMLKRPDDPALRAQLVEDLQQAFLLFYPGRTWESLRGEQRALRRRTLTLVSSVAAVLLVLVVIAASSILGWRHSVVLGNDQRLRAEVYAIEVQKQRQIAETHDREARRQTDLAQKNETEGFRQEVAQLDLPADLYGAPALESIAVDTPMARLDWIRPPLTQLAIAINEDGPPDKFPAFLTKLAITGRADNVSARYYVDTSQLPRQLSSLTLEGVHLQNPGGLRSLSGLKELSLVGTYIAIGDLPLPSGLEYLTVSGGDVEGADARRLPPSLISLAVENGGLANPDALPRTKVKKLHTDDPGLLERLPKSLTTLSLIASKLERQKFRMLRGTAIESLTVEVKAKGLDQPPEVFDIAWLPPTIRELSLTNVDIANDSALTSLSRLTKVALNNARLDLTALPTSVQDLSLDCSISVDQLASLPAGLRRLALPCAGEFPKTMQILRKFPAFEAFTGLELSDEVNFALLPATLKHLAIGAAPAAVNDTAIRLKGLQELSLDFTPDTGGSERPGSAARTREPVKANLQPVDVKDLPPSLTKLQLTNLTLTHPDKLATLSNLVELTVDRYNRRSVGIPPSLKRFVVKDFVSPADLSSMAGFK